MRTSGWVLLPGWSQSKRIFLFCARSDKKENKRLHFCPPPTTRSRLDLNQSAFSVLRARSDSVWTKRCFQPRARENARARARPSRRDGGSRRDHARTGQAGQNRLMPRNKRNHAASQGLYGPKSQGPPPPGALTAPWWQVRPPLDPGGLRGAALEPPFQSAWVQRGTTKKWRCPPPTTATPRSMARRQPRLGTHVGSLSTFEIKLCLCLCLNPSQNNNNDKNSRNVYAKCLLRTSSSSFFLEEFMHLCTHLCLHPACINTML